MTKKEIDKLKNEWDLLRYEVGDIVRDYYDDGVRVIIMRAPNSWCVYVGVPLTHPLANFDYDLLPIDCHGGVTFADSGTKEGKWPEGFYWYGWDYAHSGDLSPYHLEGGMHVSDENKAWTAKEVETDSWLAIYEFGKLMKLSELIYNKRCPGK
jgi:hypothetical protein